MEWSLERIYGRCVPDGACMLWKGGMSRDKRYPIGQEPAPEKPHGQRQVHIRRIVYQLAKGRAAPRAPKFVLVARCGKPRCVAEGCLQVLTKSERLRQVAATGVFQSPAFRAKVAAGCRRDSDLSDADVAAIVASEEPVPQLAARFGLSVGYTYAIQSGRNRRDYSSPFSALVPPQERPRP